MYEMISYKITMLAKCIDHYTKLQVDNFQAKDASEMKPVDSRLEDIVNRMFQRCFEDKKFKAAIGIAIETRRLDVVEKSILTSVKQSIAGKKKTKFVLTKHFCYLDKRHRDNFICLQDYTVIGPEPKV